MDREEIKNIIAELMPYLPVQAGVKRISLVDFYKEYLSYAEFNLATKTVGIVKLAFKHLLSFFPGNKPLDEIGLREVELFIRSLQKNAPRGYRVYYRTLKSAFNKAIDWSYIITNTFVKVKLPKVQRNEPVILDSRQLAVISMQIENEYIKNIVIFAFNTGCRLGEITNLTWNNVDLAKQLIMIGDKNFNTKSKKVRVMPMSDKIVEMLNVRREMKNNITKEIPNQVRDDIHNVKQDHPASQSDATPLQKRGKGGGYVFGKSNGTAYTTDAVSKAFKKACRKVGMDEDVHFHSLRHSFASNLVQKGVSLYSVKELLGHSSIQMTEIYSHLKLDDLREAIGKL